MVAHFKLHELTFIAGAFTGGVGAHAKRATEGVALGAVEVFGRTLGVQTGIDAEVVEHALQANHIGIEAAEAAIGQCQIRHGAAEVAHGPLHLAIGHAAAVAAIEVQAQHGTFAFTRLAGVDRLLFIEEAFVLALH